MDRSSKWKMWEVGPSETEHCTKALKPERRMQRCRMGCDSDGWIRVFSLEATLQADRNVTREQNSALGRSALKHRTGWSKEGPPSLWWFGGPWSSLSTKWYYPDPVMVPGKDLCPRWPKQCLVLLKNISSFHSGNCLPIIANYHAAREPPCVCVTWAQPLKALEKQRASFVEPGRSKIAVPAPAATESSQSSFHKWDISGVTFTVY